MALLSPPRRGRTPILISVTEGCPRSAEGVTAPGYLRPRNRRPSRTVRHHLPGFDAQLPTWESGSDMITGASRNIHLVTRKLLVSWAVARFRWVVRRKCGGPTKCECSECDDCWQGRPSCSPPRGRNSEGLTATPLVYLSSVGSWRDWRRSGNRGASPAMQ
jgi:hypothetical protein